MAIMLRRRVGLALTSAATPVPTDKGGGTTSCTAVEEQVAIAGTTVIPQQADAAFAFAVAGYRGT
jgi:hypothetical protein